MFDCGMLKSEKKNSVTKADIFFLFGLFTVALLILLFFYRNRAKGSYMEISYDGTVLWKISLSKSGQEERYYLLTDRIPDDDTIKDSAGNIQITMQELIKAEDMEWTEMIEQTAANQTGNYNIFLCRDGEVSMVKSNCPDQICVRHYPISAAGENIICLPHKIVIAITGEKEQKLDGVVY